MDHLTANGMIRIGRRVYWYRGEGVDNRLDHWLGIADAGVSVGVRELCCLVAADCSFAKAVQKLKRLGQIDIGLSRLRELVEREGRQVLDVRRHGLLPPAWTAQDCKTAPCASTQVLVGGDGVMVPVITAAEKAKRHAARRRVRRRGKPQRRRPRCRGADQGWKEFKIGLFYSADKRHCHVFATRGNHEEFGRQLRREAGKIKLGRADQKFSVTDGADWIRRQLRSCLPMLDEMILDFYHFAEHVAQASWACWGVASPQSAQWTGKMLHLAKHEGPLAVLQEIVAARSSLRSKSKRKALSNLEQYVGKRVEMMDYPRFVSAGFDIGSGPTEAKCKTVPHRLKGSGMRWDLPNAEAMAALACADQSGLMDDYWRLQRQRVA